MEKIQPVYIQASTTKCKQTYLELDKDVADAAPGPLHGRLLVHTAALGTAINASERPDPNALLQVNLSKDGCGPGVVPVRVIWGQFLLGEVVRGWVTGWVRAQKGKKASTKT